MRQLLNTTVLTLIISSINLSARNLKVGLSINEFEKEMNSSNYKETGYFLVASNPNKRKRWVVDKGVLQVTYSLLSDRVLSITFLISDEKLQAKPRGLSFTVKSFNTETGQMVIQTQKQTMKSANKSQ